MSFNNSIKTKAINKFFTHFEIIEITQMSNTVYILGTITLAFNF